LGAGFSLIVCSHNYKAELPAELGWAKSMPNQIAL